MGYGDGRKLDAKKQLIMQAAYAVGGSLMFLLG